MKWKRRGSYTVEGTVIISFICLMVGMTAALGFYCHDRTVIQSAADELAMFGSPVVRQIHASGNQGSGL